MLRRQCRQVIPPLRTGWRISSVKDADVIFVLDEGQINGFGTHQELLQNNKIYKEVFESQQTAGDADMADNSEVE